MKAWLAVFIYRGYIVILLAHTLSAEPLDGLFLPLEVVQDLIKGSTAYNQYERVKPYLFWHQSCPTIGLVSKPCSYPYIPHFFSLWELAPKKGEGITVVILDNGVAAFEIEGYSDYVKHPDLTMNPDVLGDMLNISRLYEFKSLIQHIQMVIYPNKVDDVLLENHSIQWIYDYCIKEQTDSLQKFFNNHLDAFQIQEITQGRRGIKPRGNNRFFTPVALKAPSNKKVIYEFLPLPAYANKRSLHGTHVYGLINACSGGLAPHARCIMIKVCDNNGKSDCKTLLYALTKAQVYKPDCINISLKIADDIDVFDLQQLTRLLNSFPYVVAASGNDGHTIVTESYPARCNGVEFDVGAFAYDGNTTYTIPAFSQYEPSRGPKFLAPGCTILSTGIDQRKVGYIFLSGTSMAAALTSGFVALMLAEFKDEFTREQLLKVCYKSTIRLHTTRDWQQKSALGALDMRTVLFVLHVCKALKKSIGNMVFQEQCDICIEAIFTVLVSIMEDFTTQKVVPYSFFLHTAEYSAFCNNRNVPVQHDDLITTCNDIAALIVAAYTHKKIYNKYSSQQVYARLSSLFKHKTVDLFSDLNIKIKERILAVLNKKC